MYTYSPRDAEKVASEVPLSEDPNEWPNEIMQQLYQQVEYIADFDPQIVMDRVDGERGFGFGYVLVGNKTELGPSATPDERKAVGLKEVRLPIVIRDRKLTPFDLLVTDQSKVLPLTESRLRQALFRPEVFDVTGKTPGDSPLGGQLFPPTSYGRGFGGGHEVPKTAEEDFEARLRRVLEGDKKGPKEAGVPNASKGPPGPLVRDVVPKVKQGSLLRAVLPTVPEEEYAKVAGAFETPEVWSTYASRSAFTGPALRELGAYEPSPPKEAWSPDVVQVVKAASGYTVKAASRSPWEVRTSSMDRGQATQTFGAKVVLAADLEGSVTITGDEGVTDEGPEAPRPELVKSFGLYKVRDAAGRELVGFVLPNLYDIDGTALPIAAFTNGSESALQEDIAAVPAGTSAVLPEGRPNGHGMFYRTLASGAVEGVVPMTVLGGTGAGSFSAETFDGRQIEVKLQPNVVRPALAGTACVLPADMKWLPMGDGGAVALAHNEEEYGVSLPANGEEPKEASAFVTVRAGDHNSFSLDGFPVAKVASAFLSVDDALFLLAGLGADLPSATRKLAHALHTSSPVAVPVAHALDPAPTPPAKVAADVGWLRANLVKEAGFLPDPMAVDTVLSLNFLSPDNVKTFVSYLPQMDAAQAKLGEILLASRLGLADVPADAVERCVHSLERTLDGLKILAFTPEG